MPKHKNLSNKQMKIYLFFTELCARTRLFFYWFVIANQSLQENFQKSHKSFAFKSLQF